MNNSSEFNLKLDRKNQPVITDYSPDSTTLLITFGGMAKGVVIPPFEFFNLTSEYKVKKLYIRDLYQFWYHHGLPGITDNIDGIARYLLQAFKEQRVERKIILGNSMGGYAAILFGCLVKADEVHAFSPKTFITPLKRLVYFDLWNRKQVWNLQWDKNVQREYFDLKKVLAKSNNKTKYNLYFSIQQRIDRIHSIRMQQIPNVLLHPYKEGGHKLVKYLMDSGILKDIITKSIGDNIAVNMK